MSFSLLVGGCSPADHTDAGVPALDAAICGVGFLGDPAQPIAMSVISLGASGVSSEVHDGSSIDLLFPPQGGRVVFVGVRATNIDPCGVTLSGALRDPTNNQVRVDIRPVDLVPDDAGFGSSDDGVISTFSNIPVCPNQWSATDTFGHPYQLEIALTDRAGRAADAKIHVVPQCAEPDKLTECLCLCKTGYVLGENCTIADGGID
jgi:hypothetical protein